MNAKTVFVLDSNVFIQPARTFYAFDIVPTFWEKLKELAAQNKIVSIDKVFTELQKGNDELKVWSEKEFKQYFLPTTSESVQTEFKELMRLVQNHSSYTDVAKRTFANDADGWLIAFAKAKQYDVVTNEGTAGSNTTKIKIPNLCKEFNVQCHNLFEMLRMLKVKL
ncbi:MAG: DUF4411 family protein [bacterium]|nr:DUF4411 family protein [bacterium]